MSLPRLRPCATSEVLFMDNAAASLTIEAVVHEVLLEFLQCTPLWLWRVSLKGPPFAFLGGGDRVAPLGDGVVVHDSDFFIHFSSYVDVRVVALYCNVARRCSCLCSEQCVSYLVSLPQVPISVVIVRSFVASGSPLVSLEWPRQAASYAWRAVVSLLVLSCLISASALDFMWVLANDPSSYLGGCVQS
jgi:hypothetical protein